LVKSALAFFRAELLELKFALTAFCTLPFARVVYCPALAAL